MDRRLDLIAEMTPAIWIHLSAVSLAVGIGAWVLFRRKGDARHRFWGRAWVLLMGVGAISSFWITEINDAGFSPIHALSAWTLFSIVAGVTAIRLRGRLPGAVRWHRGFLQSLYATGILIAGGFTLLPHRLLGRLSTGESYPVINYIVVSGIALAGVWLLLVTLSRGAAATRDLS